MKIMKSTMLMTSFLLVVMKAWSVEATKHSEKTEQLLQQMETQIVSTLKAIAANEVKSGRDMTDFKYKFSLPAHESASLGAVVDTNERGDGLTVLSITPGGVADELGIRPFDKIMSINGREIVPTETSDTVAQLFNLRAGDELTLVLASGDTLRTIETRVKGQRIPSIALSIGDAGIGAMTSLSNSSTDNECGRVSVFFNPPLVKDYFKAYFHKINDDHKKRNREQVKLKPGKHTIYLHELISDKVKNYRKAKPIEIDVQPNTTYHLAAKFNRAKKYSANKGEYWEPIIWKTSEKQCSFE